MLTEDTLYDFNILKLFRCFWPNILSVLEYVSIALDRMYILLLLNRMFCICPLEQYVYSVLQVLLLLFFLHFYLLLKMRYLMSNIIVALFLPSLLSVFCLIYFWALLLSAYIFKIVISS